LCTPDWETGLQKPASKLRQKIKIRRRQRYTKHDSELSSPLAHNAQSIHQVHHAPAVHAKCQVGPAVCLGQHLQHYEIANVCAIPGGPASKREDIANDRARRPILPPVVSRRPTPTQTLLDANTWKVGYGQATAVSSLPLRPRPSLKPHAKHERVRSAKTRRSITTHETRHQHPFRKHRPGPCTILKIEKPTKRSFWIPFLR